MLKLVLVALILTACTPNRNAQTPSPQAESEFLYWCKTEGRWPVFINKPTFCKDENVSRGKWDHYPIIVNAQPDMIIETLEAIESFNAQLGFRLFAFEVSSRRPDIDVVYRGYHPYAWAEAAHYSRGGRDYAKVLAYGNLPEANRSDVILHELGHLVGLRHDAETTLSLMYPAEASRVAFVERQDILALRAIYLK